MRVLGAAVGGGADFEAVEDGFGGGERLAVRVDGC
jgi:hypothetical protein